MIVSKPFSKFNLLFFFSGGDFLEECEGKQKNDSLYFSLELRRMQLEKNIGLYLFLETYRKMMSILNGEFMIDEKKNANGSETYTVCKSGKNFQFF